MNKFTLIIMYVLWIAAILFVLATTFTNFEHLDLNAIAFVLLLFATINSFLAISRKVKDEENK